MEKKYWETNSIEACDTFVCDATALVLLLHGYFLICRIEGCNWLAKNSERLSVIDQDSLVAVGI
jgi:hypothetical protein